MNNIPDFDLSDDSEDFASNRLQNEWATLSAIREMLGIATKGAVQPTYEQSLAVGKVIAPKIFASNKTIIGKTPENQLVQEYRQKAARLSQIENRKIHPTKIVDKEIEELDPLLMTGGEDNLLRKRRRTLESVKQLLTDKKYTENQLIIRDLFKAERNLPFPPIEGDTYRDFQVSEDRGLRIRMLHPDPSEHLMGADLIYENYWDKKQLMRLALVQYKIWDGQVLYTSQAYNLEDQLTKLKNIFCDNQYCTPFSNSARANAYRLPFCTAFLRPTDALQSPDSRLISSGLHIPICVVSRSWKDTGRGGKKIESKDIRSEALSHTVFEELFNTNMLGSKWLTYTEVEELYKKHKILAPKERIILHAQEFNL